ncbi:MAG: hypothetical protein ABSE49_21435 [Polyangiaceae bacterium]|jgi:hypothetical protein
MTERFDICVATKVRTPEERRAFFGTLAAPASSLIAWPVWTMRVRGSEVVESDWNDEPIEVPEGWVVCLYPRVRSSSDGVWLVEIVGTDEIWTLSVPATLLLTRMNDLLAVMLHAAREGVPCIAGNEYSMAAVRRTGADAMVEAASPFSLATHAVVSKGIRLRGWAALREEGDRVLVARR